MVHVVDGSCCNQLYCLTAVFISSCLGGGRFMCWALHLVLCKEALVELDYISFPLTTRLLSVLQKVSFAFPF